MQASEQKSLEEVFDASDREKILKEIYDLTTNLRSFITKNLKEVQNYEAIVRTHEARMMHKVNLLLATNFGKSVPRKELKESFLFLLSTYQTRYPNLGFRYLLRIAAQDRLHHFLSESFEL